MIFLEVKSLEDFSKEIVIPNFHLFSNDPISNRVTSIVSLHNSPHMFLFMSMFWYILNATLILFVIM